MWLLPADTDVSARHIDLLRSSKPTGSLASIDQYSSALLALPHVVDTVDVEAIGSARDEPCCLKSTHCRHSFAIVNELEVTMKTVVHIEFIASHLASRKLGIS